MGVERIKEKVLIALRIRDGIHKIFRKNGVNTVLCTNRVNSLYNQTDEYAEGFICEYYYGIPSKIYTPLGYLEIWSGGIVNDEKCSDAIKEIENTFGFILKQEEKHDNNGIHGGWYYITKLPWSNAELKCECVERDRKNYIKYKIASKLYEGIAKGC